MSLASNPFLNPPRLPSPHHGRLRDRSASRSPARPPTRYCDPLLRDLSPTSTLRAFVTDPDDVGAVDPLAVSIRSSSASERALGAKAAQACLDLRSWTRELESWQWPGTFDMPEPARKRLRISSLTASPEADDPTGGYWGSMLGRTVQTYEQRADDIGQQLDEIDVEALKDYVLTSHYRVDSRPSSRDDRDGTAATAAASMATDLKELNDYTAVVTATILQALPFLSRLNRLLDMWTIRLSILRSAPDYLRDLRKAQIDLDNAWTTISGPSISADDAAPSQLDRATVTVMKSTIALQVRSLGKKLDCFLDGLEGRDDTVPDTWIDDFELLESAYGSWVVLAERRILEDEWNARKIKAAQEQASQLGGIEHGIQDVSNLDPISETKNPATDKEPTVQVSVDPAPDSHLSEKQPRIPPPILIPPTNIEHAPDSAPLTATISAGSSRSRTPTSLSKEEGIGGQVAKRRAAFLNTEIEVNNALKTSKSPVRSFEHASNAFTRLFKKDRSPEQVRPKRVVSNKISPVGSTDESMASPLDYRSSTPLSASSSKWSLHSQPSPILPAPSSSKDSETATPEIVAAESKNGGLEDEIESTTATSTSNSGTQAPDPGDETEALEDAAPRTYKLAGLHSPFHSPDKEEFPADVKEDLPEDKPLVSPPEVSVSQMSSARLRNSENVDPSTMVRRVEAKNNTPSITVISQTFDDGSSQNIPAASKDGLDSIQASDRLLSGSRILTTQSYSPREIPNHDDVVLPNGTDVPSVLSLQNPATHKDDTVISEPLMIEKDHTSKDSATSEVTQPLQILSASTSSNTSHSQPALDQLRSSSSPPEASDPLKLNEVSLQPFESEGLTAPRYRNNRASMVSIESFPGSELKSIDIQRISRHNSTSSSATPPQTPSVATNVEGSDRTLPNRLTETAAASKPLPRRTSLVNESTYGGRHTPPLVRGMSDSSPNIKSSQASPVASLNPAPLNSAIAKRRGKNTLRTERELSASPLSSTDAAAKKSSHLNVPEDSFDRHVSEVLETLPGQIRFRSRPGAETPVPRIGDGKGYNAPRPKLPTTRVPAKSGSMTIAPAESSPRKSSSASDPEVKLYHLTQTGRDEPIKLFVRLVGEGERVMVRVGGGWADLADYLRQYAEHHGSRTVSEGTLEMQTTLNALTRKVSGPAEARARTPGPDTPTTITTTNGTHRPGSRDSDKDWFDPMPPAGDGRSTPVSQPSSVFNRNNNGRQTPTGSLHTTTPKSITSTAHTSRPPTANGFSRPPSRQNTPDVGLAGPSSGKKAELPEHKAKWVEGMIERAKKASAEKSKEDSQKYFGELGKAGGTRRVIFRSASSGVGTPPPASSGEKK